MEFDDLEQIEELRDIFQEITDCLNDIIALSKRKQDGEDVKKELEAASGLLLVKMLQLQKIQ